jgi:glycosyltransferase involved in cell wall biosynthesis
VPHAVDSEFFSQESEKLRPERQHLREQWGIDNASTVFLFAGKFIENKRPLDFVRAIGAAAQAGGPVCGLMVGDGPLRLACEELSRSESFPVSFAGFLNQSEIPRAYVAADALVLPSEGETWGLVVNEAMDCGLPCFVSDRVGCGPDLIVSQETGAIFSLGDKVGLVNLLISLSSDPQCLARMGRQAKKRASAYSVDAACNALLEAVSRTVKNGL